jgi:phosphinothricin tripeptide acetyl hydrolase
MVVNQQLETIISMVTALMEEVMPIVRADKATTIVEMRQKFNEAYSQFKVAEDIITESVNADGVSAEWIIPPNAIPERVLLYLHGGGYVLCSVETHRDLMARVARSANARVLGIDYRRAPEHPFPAAVEDAVTAYRWLIKNGFNPADMTIIGDSAGGGLTVATLVVLRDASESLPAAAVCLSPWVDLEGLGNSMITNAQIDPFVPKELLVFLAQKYLGNRNRRIPLAAPLYADLKGLPPLLIQVGGDETLLDDATRLAKRAEEAGVQVSLAIWPHMFHVWHLFASMLPEGEEAIAAIGTFIKAHLSGNLFTT